jgi:hypothetical protein
MGLAKTIQLQTQPTPVSCTATCIAMALGVPVADLGVPLDQAFGFTDFGVFLAERGIWMRHCVRSHRYGEKFMHGTVYLLAVRSLNKIGTDHAVLLDTRPPRKTGLVQDGGGAEYNEFSGWQFFDPNTGREDKHSYDWAWEDLTVGFCELRERTQYTIGAPPAGTQR